jgi:hypothetical protein
MALQLQHEGLQWLWRCAEEGSGMEPSVSFQCMELVQDAVNRGCDISMAKERTPLLVSDTSSGASHGLTTGAAAFLPSAVPLLSYHFFFWWPVSLTFQLACRHHSHLYMHTVGHFAPGSHTVERFLGLHISRKSDGSRFLSQPGLLQKLFDKHPHIAALSTFPTVLMTTMFCEEF